GRLVEPDEGAHTDEEKDLLAAAAGWEGLSAEEAAIHAIPEEEWMRDEVPGDEVVADEEFEDRLYEEWPEPEEEYGAESAYDEEEEADFWSGETPLAWEPGAGVEPGVGEESAAGEGSAAGEEPAGGEERYGGGADESGQREERGWAVPTGGCPPPGSWAGCGHRRTVARH